MDERLIVSSDRQIVISNYEEISEITIEPNIFAKVEMIKLPIDKPYDANLNIKISHDSHLEVVIVDFLQSNSTLNINVDLADSSELDLHLGTFTSSSIDKKFDISVNQTGVRSSSLVSMLGVSHDTSKLTFLGATKICHGAIKSKARQEGRIANLSPDVKTACSPTLLIDENDILASHGAVLGQIEEGQLFYLMSRGLTRTEAENIVTLGYLKPVIAMVSLKETQEQLTKIIESKVTKL